MSDCTRPLIAIAGLAHESSTFSPARTEAAAFRPLRGRDVVAAYPFLQPRARGNDEEQEEDDLATAADWRGTLIGHALPGGMVTAAAYAELAGEIEARLRDIVLTAATVDRRPLAGIYLDLHGAMVVDQPQGSSDRSAASRLPDDAEADLVARIRGIPGIGEGVVVAASMDLHGNVSRELVEGVDLLTAFRTAPHVDEMETRRRACATLVEVSRAQQTRPGLTASISHLPAKAYVQIPMLLTGEMTSTRIHPARAIYAAVAAVAANREQGIVDAALLVGYAWADAPRDCAAVVVTGWNADAAARGAEKLARMLWRAREGFVVGGAEGVAASLDECVDAAIAAAKEEDAHQRFPFFISDSGDNPTAGGAGDVTWTLRRLLARAETGGGGEEEGGKERKEEEEREMADGLPLSFLYASLPGGDAVMQAARTCSVGDRLTVAAGGQVDSTGGGPVRLDGTVEAIKLGDENAAAEVVLRVQSGGREAAAGGEATATSGGGGDNDSRDSCRGRHRHDHRHDHRHRHQPGQTADLGDGPAASSRLCGLCGPLGCRQPTRLWAGWCWPGPRRASTRRAVFVILTARRKPYHRGADLADLGFPPSRLAGARVAVVVKIGYLEPELAALARSWRLALTPGAVDQHLARLRFARVRRPLWPLDADMADPELQAAVVGGRRRRRVVVDDEAEGSWQRPLAACREE